MDIKYYTDEQTGRVFAVGSGKHEYAEGIDPVIAERLIERHIVSKNDLCVPILTKGIAKVQAPDVYDFERGKNIARDKVLSKHYAKVGRALAAYKAGLEILVSGTDQRIGYCQDKVKNANARLDAIE